MSAPLIQLQEVSKVYRVGGPPWRRRGVLGVSSVSLEVLPGKHLGVVGESGSGKSTLVRLVLGLMRPTSGEVRFGGRNLASLGQREMQTVRREMQPVFQDSSSAFNPRQSVRQSLLAPLEVHSIGDRKTRERRVLGALEEVGLDESFAQRRPSGLSGGERQRVAIARALVLEPSVIVADEPTSALDVSVQARILKLLRRIAKDRGVTFVFVSHNLAVVRQVCDDVAVMRGGEVVERGRLADVFGAPQHVYTQKLLGAVPTVRRNVTVRGSAPEARQGVERVEAAK